MTIKVVATSQYLLKESDPSVNRYVFSYTIQIHNQGELSAQLLSRHWIITDANGSVEEVRGEGVVGEQPVIEPGQHFEYTSFAILKTPVGSMHGGYQLIDSNEVHFEAPISPFRLAIPQLLN
jgi:ApaG protein